MAGPGRRKCSSTAAVIALSAGVKRTRTLSGKRSTFSSPLKTSFDRLAWLFYPVILQATKASDADPFVSLGALSRGPNSRGVSTRSHYLVSEAPMHRCPRGLLPGAGFLILAMNMTLQSAPAQEDKADDEKKAAENATRALLQRAEDEYRVF